MLFFGFGWLFFMRQLFKDYEVPCYCRVFIIMTTKMLTTGSNCLDHCVCWQVRQYIVQVVFSVTFAFSCTMFELIIFEILGALSSRWVCFIYRIQLCFIISYWICRYVIFLSLPQLQVFSLEVESLCDTACAHLCGAFLHWLLCCQQHTPVWVWPISSLWK